MEKRVIKTNSKYVKRCLEKIFEGSKYEYSIEIISNKSIPSSKAVKYVMFLIYKKLKKKKFFKMKLLLSFIFPFVQAFVINKENHIYFFGENTKKNLFLLLIFLSFLNLKSDKINRILSSNLFLVKFFSLPTSSKFRLTDCNLIKHIGPNHLITTIEHKGYLTIPYFIFTDLLPENCKEIPKKKKFCAFIFSNYSLERIFFFRKLSKYKKVDSYGHVLKNSEVPEKLVKKYPDRIDLNPRLYKEYKFVICFENSFSKDYITEKLPQAMNGESIPIYRGASNVREYFNTSSFINYEDYDCNYDKMIEKIIELDQDDEKYEEFLKRPWTTKKNLEKIEEKQKDFRNFLLKKFYNEEYE